MKYEGDQYWLAKPSDEVASDLDQYHRTGSMWSGHPIYQAWIRNSIAYYSTVLDASAWDTSLVYTGEQGELVKMSVPQARSLVRQMLTLTTKQRLSFDVIAETKGSDVIKDVRLGNAVIEQTLTDQQVDTKSEMLAEQALVLGISFLKTTWRTDKGRPYISDGEKLLYDGDIDISVLHVDDCLFDYSIPNWHDLDWAEARVIKNRWSLIAQFPNLKEEILKLPSIQQISGMSGYRSNYQAVSHDENVYCYELYHKPTPAMPLGRMMFYASHDTIFYDGENRYKTIPIEPMRPEPVFGSGFGYPMFSSLLPSQEMLDHCLSAAATNFGNLAVNNIVSPRGAGISVQEISGMNWLSYTPQNVPGGGKPEVLDLSKTNPQVLEFPKQLLQGMQQMSNINSAARGEPPPGITAGVAIATLTANAIEFLSSVSKSYEICLENSMMHVLNAYNKFAMTPHSVSIKGKNNQMSSKDFTGKDLDMMKSVKITRQNPIMATMTGRLEIAEKMMDKGLITDVQSYVSVLDGAPLSVLYEVDLSQNDLIETENEQMLEGQQVLTLMTDNHPLHVRKHSALLNDPAIRRSNSAVKLILDHIEEHAQLEATMDPNLQAMLMTGKAPQLAMGPGGPPPGAGGPPPGAGGPPPGAGGPPPMHGAPQPAIEAPTMHHGFAPPPHPGAPDQGPAAHANVLAQEMGPQDVKPSNQAPDLNGRM